MSIAIRAADGRYRRLNTEKETRRMTENQKEAWAGVLLTALIVGILLGGLLMLRLAAPQ